ncbi:MAG: gamma-glutamyl-gamma-aminobutyrate hydrolase family protein [Pseudomonadota bacterium]
MKLHYLQHVHFETPGFILDWAQQKNAKITSTLFFEQDYQLPQEQDFDFLVVMGGPMGVNDNDDYPWLNEEKKLIQFTIEAGKPVIGICLGAQLIASALGANVYQGTKEIGWAPIEIVNKGYYFKNFPEQQTVMHWHGDTFDLPEGATLLASNDVTKNQAFELNNVVGLQFHFEMGEENINSILEHAANDLTDDPHVQTKEQILTQTEYFEPNKKILFDILDKLSETI